MLSLETVNNKYNRILSSIRRDFIVFIFLPYSFEKNPWAHIISYALFDGLIYGWAYIRGAYIWNGVHVKNLVGL